MEVLDSLDGLPRRARHQCRVSALLDPYVRQRAQGGSNSVIDFLFTYYNLTPRQLRWWHPGFGVTLTGPETGEYEVRLADRRPSRASRRSDKLGIGPSSGFWTR